MGPGSKIALAPKFSAWTGEDAARQHSLVRDYVKLALHDEDNRNRELYVFGPRAGEHLLGRVLLRTALAKGSAALREQYTERFGRDEGDHRRDEEAEELLGLASGHATLARQWARDWVMLSPGAANVSRRTRMRLEQGTGPCLET